VKRKTKKKTRIAILASGNGTNLQAIINAVRTRKLRHVEIALVISDRSRARALERAHHAKLTALFLDPTRFATRNAYERELDIRLRAMEVDYIVLAGFMRILGRSLVRRWHNKILNVHPALLPSFKGPHGIRDALKFGAKVTGVTIHFVTPKVDDGPIILQEALPIHEGETETALTKRIHTVEHRLYPKAIGLLAEGKVVVKGRKVVDKR